MGQRTQVAINVKFVGGDGKEYIEREVYHYQWGGYHTGMFENLVGLFINAKNYLIKLNFVNFTESYLQEFEARINGNKYTNKKNLLRTDFVDMINSEKNTKTSDELKYYEEFHGKTINEVSEKEFWDFALNYQDCNDGRILIDILLEKGKSYCKWNFAKYKSFENDKDKFKKIAENELTKNVKEIYKYWFYVIDEDLQDVTDIVAIEEKVDSYFEKLNKEYKEAKLQIILYVTGLTVVTLAVVKSCKRLGYGLVCMHFDRDSNSYIAQPILD